jgi:ABC-2 type transport system ATP-binding protein
MQQPNMLQIRDLHKRFGDRPVLSGLNLEIAPGELFTLLGPNGSGKTTTINITCGLLQPDRGQVQIDAEPLSHLSRFRIGVVAQENLLYRNLSCAENLRFFGQLYGLSRSALRQRVQECLLAVNLLDRAKTPVGTLSGGMQRRLNIAAAIIHQPRLLVLDEPTTGLDIEARYEIWSLVRSLQQQGTAILLTTHMLDEAQALSQRLGILKGGQLLAKGSLDDLYQHLPTRDVVHIETLDETRAIRRGVERGLIPRRYGGQLYFWLPQPMELQSIADCFSGIPLGAIARQTPRLEHVYLELTGAGGC